VLEIRDLDTLRTVADALRAQIYEQLAGRALTVKELAARLGLAPGRLYYHVNLLESRGLITVVDQHMVGNLVEKVFRAAAYELEIAPSLLAFETRPGRESINSVLLSTLDATREDVLRSLEARRDALEAGAPERPRTMIVTRLLDRIPESRAAEFQSRLRALLADFAAAGVGETWDEEEAQAYALTVAFYPHFDYPEEGGPA